ncbi:hypothetical protein TVAG_454100 [Trichomonas vaginalis G3]|uniref:AIG1-type G domain-containing protein n=1 Tax=Trichomonas vaginalis (strain ATCC PRA-98 / G3) TaxID=412133 RepID=A2DPY6_TRIV3|nr:GTPase, IMAP family member-related family [Trichomonas vaginalis G3]EAY17582.1 hypothetical protein TVAG_454100 [Trichomonas vaginalis G3]KAI5520626.1 GTPase, IMAP family member-related family [Trichomonas vaginalis G3]|eukprot:XP_001329717.1 hypothetical protein [Trichomonas vaginalis G3]
MLTGEVGSGVSSVCNLYLNGDMFTTSNDSTVCTSVPKFQSRIVNGVERIAIDTVGYDDEMVSKEKTSSLSQFIKENSLGINAIGLVKRALSVKLSTGDKNAIKTAIEIFGKAILSHICVIITFCEEDFPDRNAHFEQFNPQITSYLSEVSGINEIPQIPLFYVDCAKPDKDFVIENMTRLHEWAAKCNKIN